MKGVMIIFISKEDHTSSPSPRRKLKERGRCLRLENATGRSVTFLISLSISLALHLGSLLIFSVNCMYLTMFITVRSDVG